MKKVLSIADLENRLVETWPPTMAKATRTVYGVPRGGWNIGMLLQHLGLARLVDNPEAADYIVDDIVDSGHTRDKWLEEYPNKKFWAPYDKTSFENNIHQHEWIVFPWEGSADQDGQELVTRMLQMIGEDPTRDGLLDTPERVVRSWHELYAGYHMDPEKVLGTVFDSENKDMVLCRNIEFSSMCEHHMLPFTGHVTIGYIPDGKVVGLSKLARLVDVYAKRMQIQEQFTSQIAQAMTKHIPGIAGAAVVVTAKHQCMSCRGVGKQDSDMVTSALTGKFREPVVRMEFMSLLRPFK